MLNGDFGDFFDSARQDEVTETVIESVTGVEWVPVKEAAHILDLSERSIWRRIKKGKLEKKEEDGRTYVRSIAQKSSSRTLTTVMTE